MCTMAPSKDISFSSYFSWYQICLPLKKKKAAGFLGDQEFDANFGAENEFCKNAWTVFTRRIQEMCLIFQTVQCCSTSVVLRSRLHWGRRDVCPMTAVDTRREVETSGSNLDPCSSACM